MLVAFAYGLVSAVASDLSGLEPRNDRQVEQLGYEAGADDQPQAQGGCACVAARTALVEGPHPRRLPEHDLLRERRLWGRDGRARLLPLTRQGFDARASGLAGRPAREPGSVRP